MTEESDDDRTDPSASDAGGGDAGTGTTSESAPTTAGTDDAAAAPLDDLAREVRARREDRESRTEGNDPPDDFFESVDVAEVDDEAVWESFAEGETTPEARVGLGAEAERAAGADEHVVPKRGFCQRCPHFSAPPEATCTHEGTTIVEVVDTDHFRVRDCPVVDEEDVAADLD